ncbi:LysR family transcriptional regulator [Alteribacillus sp. YIM 98480]|uniref:LysR family transcriptional regulator n=1 Tax=Alteribacillus sp. YIM 98480 TaxID=2606599 RepID=UPI00131BC0E1|nr:LysR family transcriptional regulator [Alteribacillus sp. YIM 98480]
MNEIDFQMLICIREEQHITKAAERLFVTPPALIYRIRQLEKKIGVKITVKKGKQITLTPEGEYLASQANKYLLEWSKTKDYVLNMSDEVQGTFRIGVSRVIANYKLAPILKKFVTIYPKVKLIVDTGISTDMFQLLQTEDIHLAIVRGGENNFNWPDEKHLIKSENILLISHKKIEMEDLPNIPRVNYKVSSPYFTEIVNQWWNERFTHPPNITMQVDNFEICKEMVRNELGYAFIPSIFLSDNDQFYFEKLLTKNGGVLNLGTWMLYRKSSLALSMVQRFTQYIKSIDF